MTIQAPSILLMGPPGSGKTDSLLTLVEASIETFVLVTEPSGVDSLLDSAARRKLPLDLLHWSVVAPASPGWKAMGENLTTIKAMSYKDISEIKQGIGKREMVQMETLLKRLQNFHCDRTGRDYGDVTAWGASHALALDSLSGLSLLALHHTVGFKSSPHQGEWGIAMSLVEQLILKLSSDCQCFFVLTAHAEREPDELGGGAKIMVSTLGRKLAPKIPRFFGDFIRATRSGKDFIWSNADRESDLKNRAFPLGDKLAPSFAPAVDTHKRRLAAVPTSLHQSAGGAAPSDPALPQVAPAA